MSALAKPGIYTTNSDSGATSACVNLDHVKDISKVDAPAATENGKTSYKIIFSILATDNQPRKVEWEYKDVAGAQAARDADYTAVLTAFAVAIP